MIYLKVTLIIGFLSCFVTTNTHAQASMNIDSVRKALLVSQQNYKASTLNNKPISCVFATNSFRENDAFRNNSRSESSTTHEPLPKKIATPPIPISTNNVISQDEIYYIFSPKSNATMVERAILGILLIGQIR